LHRQPASKIEAADLLDRLVAQGVPGGRGLGAWQALLRAQATLIRQLDKDLEEETGLALAETLTCSLSWRWPAESCE